MESSFFYLQAEKNLKNSDFINRLETYCNENKIQAYLVNKPLGEAKYSYEYKDAFVLLMPNHKITFINFSENQENFKEYVDDFLEDLGSLSDKYRYREFIGRPKEWKKDLVVCLPVLDKSDSIPSFLNNIRIEDVNRKRICELLISLLTGSINNIEKIKAEVPVNTLDKVKQKIQLFDGDQTRFVYENLNKSPVLIQGLSGTGKTELLLHKLKEIYVENDMAKIVFTCHNKILADSLKRRIPDFFNFMKVEQQIKWEERLWCMHAWGSRNEINSGTYSYICNFYKIPFETYSFNSTFESVCKRALDAIKSLGHTEKAFDFMLIDESQDFPTSFFELCNYVTKKNIYIAGDIFQSIFDEAPSHSIEPDYLLNKCYRTDPRTLMFAHALGMGLFEAKKLRWLEDQEWNSCGYKIQKFNNQNGLYRLSREPLRRFEDVDRNELNSVELLKIKGRYYENVSAEIYSVIKKIIKENPTVCPDDIGIIMMDKGNQTYALADELEQMIPRIAPGWSVNKAHETKRNKKGELFVSNRNNVKGLEFPFVICITKKIQDTYGYRNALYMTLTRSFLQTYLLISDEFNHECLESIHGGLDKINKFGYIEAIQPSDSEKEAIRTTIKHSRETLSHFDFVTNIFDDLQISPIFREALFETVKKVVGEDFDYAEVREVIEFNYKIMLRGSGNK